MSENRASKQHSSKTTKAKGSEGISATDTSSFLLLNDIRGVLCSVLILDFTLGPSGLSLTELWNTLISPEIADAGTRVVLCGISGYLTPLWRLSLECHSG